MALLAAAMLVSSCRHEPVITFRSLLKEMAADETLTRYPSTAYRLVQYSSYDRRSVNPDSAGWFANNDYTHFIREEINEGRREFVMLETEEPGAIVRWWMSAGGTSSSSFASFANSVSIATSSSSLSCGIAIGPTAAVPASAWR